MVCNLIYSLYTDVFCSPVLQPSSSDEYSPDAEIIWRCSQDAHVRFRIKIKLINLICKYLTSSHEWLALVQRWWVKLNYKYTKHYIMLKFDLVLIDFGLGFRLDSYCEYIRCDLY